jgi:CheY-like chemotaxis protein
MVKELKSCAQPVASSTYLSTPRPLRILVVDNETATAIANELVLWGHEVAIALDPGAAVRLLSSWQPDVVMARLEMPPSRGDALMDLVAREFPLVRRVLYHESGAMRTEALL